MPHCAPTSGGLNFPGRMEEPSPRWADDGFINLFDVQQTVDRRVNEESPHPCQCEPGA